jgi:LDH2 family malate/lactate/ureidoglycolate dehydrogenase
VLAGGVVLPIGEHKGSGLSMFMDIFGGVITGANFGGDVADQYKALDRAQDVGHFFLAMKPNLFVSEDEYRRRIDTLIDRMKSSPPAEGFGEVLVPGEPEDRQEAERRRKGIPYASAEISPLRDEAKRAGVQPLVVSDRPIA